ncbi:unnamed protein product [Heterobilharzia americana]|nr:unnamed protein product [Heterobilharzia americana]
MPGKSGRVSSELSCHEVSPLKEREKVNIGPFCTTTAETFIMRLSIPHLHSGLRPKYRHYNMNEMH